MDNKQKSIDENSRDKIRNDIRENYFVEAGAGSGKTTVLVERMVKMIEEDIDISQICAITFTKAAANEFYDRFQRKLVEKSLENNCYKQKYLEALQNIDLAFMGTIDSFCNTIMSEHPNEGLIPSDSTIIDEDLAQELYKKEYVNILNGLYSDKQLEDKAKTFLKYDNRPEETFILTLNALLSHRDCNVVVPVYSKDNIDEKYKNEIKTIRKIIKVLNNNPNFFNCKNEELNQKFVKDFSSFERVFDNNWDDNISNLLYAYKHTFGNSELRLYIDPIVEKALQEGIDYFVIREGRKQYYQLNPDKLPAIINEITHNKYAATLDFVNDAKNKMLDTLRKQGNLTFNDYLVYLRDTLRNDAANQGKLITHISKRHKYYLIDEFQDTDPIQAEIFFYLSSEVIKPNWFDCVPRKGSLFIVGDPKQSIYRFKNADVSSYLKIEQMFKQPVGEVLHLYNNHRSTYEIKEWFNNTFNKLLVKGADQAGYEDIPIDQNDKTKGLSNVYKYDISARPSNDLDRDEYRTKDIILKLYNNPKYEICCKVRKDNKDTFYTRKIDWNDIMLITPSKSSLSKYTRVFREAGIPYYVEGNIDFNECKALSIYVSFFGAVTNPTDNRYLYQTLKSKLFNIKEKELSNAIDKGYVLSILTDTSNISLPESLSNALETLKAYADEAKLMNPSSLFAKIINEVKAFKVQGNENTEYVYYALELLKTKVVSKEVITNIDALHFLEDLLEKTKNTERCPGLMMDGNQVHLANLHKVKGLEAPVVILAHPNTSSRAADFRIVRTNKENLGYLFNISKTLDNGSKQTIIQTTMYDEPYKADEEASMQAEKIRLEYVAATRAKNILIIANSLTANGPSKNNPWIDLLTANEKICDIDDVLANEKAKPHNLNPVKYDSVGEVECILNNNKKSSGIEFANPSKLTTEVLTELEENDEKRQKQMYESNGDNYSTVIGTMVHRLMELIILSKDKINKNSVVDNVINDYLVGDLSDKERDIRFTLESVYETIHNGGYKQKGKAPSDILPILLNAEKIFVETPFTYKEDKIVWNGIIDVIYLKENQLHIVDWKTNKDDEDLDNKYQLQLEAYKKAVTKTTGLGVADALTYHITL